jgi:hypothetical protein
MHEMEMYILAISVQGDIPPPLHICVAAVVVVQAGTGSEALIQKVPAFGRRPAGALLGCWVQPVAQCAYDHMESMRGIRRRVAAAVCSAPTPMWCET